MLVLQGASPSKGEEPVAAENRLTAEQFDALAPGDVVTIESGLEFGRRRYTTGKFGRVVGRHILVTSHTGRARQRPAG